LVCAALWASYPVRGGVNADGTATPDDKSTAPAEAQPEEYNNWIEFGLGGVIVKGDERQFEQEHRIPAEQVFGGIQDLHFEQSIGKDVQLLLDGHALFDSNDYGLRLRLTKAKLGYIEVGYDEFRSWYDGNGGFYPPNGQFFSPNFPEMHIDRGDAWVELGLRVPDWPEITFRYSHEFRDGQKDSTIWGDTNLTGLGVTRKIVPSFRNIDETRDTFTLDATKTFGNTDVLLGMRYEHDDNDYSLNFIRGAGQVPPVVAPPGQQRFFTQHQRDNVDLFSGHAIAETRFSDTFWFTSAYSYTTMTNDLSGSRLPGTTFDAAFGEPVPSLSSRDHAFIDLAGTSQVDQHIVNANLYWVPAKDVTLVGGFRYTHEQRDSDSVFLAVEPTANVPPFSDTNPEKGFHLGTPEPNAGARSSDYDRFAQNVELRLTGLADWLIYARGEWEEEWGHVAEHQSPDEDVPLDKNTDSLYQKYTIGANWYPLMRLNFSGQYYHKIVSYGDDITTASFPRLINQDWKTDNVNVRMTIHPKIAASLGSLSLVTRYDFTRTSIDGQWEVFSDGILLNEEQTGVITKHVISESINWSPLARFYLQTDFSYVWDRTDTPASSIILVPDSGTPTVLNAENDYWTFTASSGYIINDKTDLRATYTYYRANDYVDNSLVGVPYGAGAREHIASATLTRQLNKRVRLQLSYTFYDYTDQTSGGHNNYQAHSIFSSLQFRF
jgi:hypothetical protein